MTTNTSLSFLVRLAILQTSNVSLKIGTSQILNSWIHVVMTPE